MQRAMLGVVAVLFTLSPLVASAQGPTSATDVTKTEWETVQNAPEGGVDRQVKVVDIGKANVAVGILHRGATSSDGGLPRGIAHTEVTEVYYIVSGSGTLVTGGTFGSVNQIPAESDIVTVLVGPSITGTSTNGHSRHVSEGDIVVIPAGVFHGWTEIEDHVTYLSIRPDPDKILPAGYVNPVIDP